MLPSLRPLACGVLLLIVAVIAPWIPNTPLYRSLPPAQPGTHAPQPSRPAALSLAFVPNSGQFDPAIRFQAQSMGNRLSFTSNEVVLALPVAPPKARAEYTSVLPDIKHTSISSDLAPPPAVVRIRFDAANPAPDLAGETRMAGVANYIIGNDPSKWRTNLPTYARVVYDRLYPGIALSYDGANGQLKSTYTVAPGADPAAIRWRYDGAADVRVDATTGDLLIDLPLAAQADGLAPALTEHAPIAWQTIDGQRVPVTARYALDADGGIGFALGDYDPGHPLIIDPTLTYSSYFGGQGDDPAYDIAADDAGNTYIIGTSGAGATVMKLNAAGDTQLYSTYLGGESEEQGLGIAIDSSGNAYITGWTSSTDFPTINPIQASKGGDHCDYRPCPDAFVAKLNANGSALLFSTYLGGESPDYSYAIAVDREGNPTITGHTLSGAFPLANPLQATKGIDSDAFIAKLNANGSALVFSTYFGGDLSDYGYGVATDDQGYIYAMGMTSSRDLALVTPLQASLFGPSDLFVSKLKPDGSALVFSTYLGGNEIEYGEGIAVDPMGNVYVTGGTESTNYPRVNPLDSSLGGVVDAFVSKISADGQKLLYSTYLGGSAFDFAFDIAVTPDGNASITGYTDSGDFPTAKPIQPSKGPNPSCSSFLCEAFVARLSASGKRLLFSTFLGGEADDIGYGIALSDGAIHLAGLTDSTDFPTASPYQGMLGGGYDAFVARIDIPETVLVNTLLDDRSGLPIQNKSGMLALYEGTALLAESLFTTDANGVFTIAFSGPISQSVHLEYSAISGYTRQFYDRKPVQSQADGVALHSGQNVLTTRLVSATTLVNTLLNEYTGQPIGAASGTVSAYAGTTLLETVPFTTSASGVFTATFSTMINQSALINYKIDGYLPQYYDRALSTAQATPILLLSGRTDLTARLWPTTSLETTLLGDLTGEPITNTLGIVAVFSGTTLLEQRSFISDAQGRARIAFSTPISQSVYVGYEVANYASQYYDRQPSLLQANPVQLRGGNNQLTARLMPGPTLINTLIDDRSGLPISNTTGLLRVYNGVKQLYGGTFRTDASGVYTMTFPILLEPNVWLEYSGVAGHARQFYDRALTRDQAVPATLNPGQTMLTTRLLAAPQFVNTLLDDASGQPLGNHSSSATFYLGTSSLEAQSFKTSASGVYTLTLINTPISDSLRLEHSAAGVYPRQFYDRKPVLALASPLLLHSDVTTLTTRLSRATTLNVTFTNDITGQPIPSASGFIDVYSDTTRLLSLQLNTDINGIARLNFNRPISQSVYLKYSLSGYPSQFYDRKPAQGDPVALQFGANTLTARLFTSPLFRNTLLDDTTGQPIPNMSGLVTLSAVNQSPYQRSFTTDASGIYTITLNSSLIGQDVQLAYTHIGSYPDQYYDRAIGPDQAHLVTLSFGVNALTTRLLPPATLINTVVDDATGQPIANTTIFVVLYGNPAYPNGARFITDASGVYTSTLKSFLNQGISIGYIVDGYPVQYHDRMLSLGRATPVLIQSGPVMFTTRLLKTLVYVPPTPSPTVAPPTETASPTPVTPSPSVATPTAISTPTATPTATVGPAVQDNRAYLPIVVTSP
jgi:hypothetical protein